MNAEVEKMEQTFIIRRMQTSYYTNHREYRETKQKNKRKGMRILEADRKRQVEAEGRRQQKAEGRNRKKRDNINDEDSETCSYSRKYNAGEDGRKGT